MPWVNPSGGTYTLQQGKYLYENIYGSAPTSDWRWWRHSAYSSSPSAHFGNGSLTNINILGSYDQGEYYNGNFTIYAGTPGTATIRLCLEGCDTTHDWTTYQTRTYTIIVPADNPFRVNINGVWKQCSKSYVKVNGVWKEVATIKTNVGGTWK